MVIIKKIILRILKKLGYRIIKQKKYSYRIGKKNLNIGCGGYFISGFVSLDMESEWYHKDNQQGKFIPYNIISDNIPADSNVVDNIYCSHVIEHLENENVYRLFLESYRVLKKGGVFRISCPDAEFLWNVSKFNNEYWNWRLLWFSSELSLTNTGEITQADFLIRDIATPRSKHYKYSLENPVSKVDFNNNMDKELSSLTKELVFRQKYPGDHINYWYYDKIKTLGKEVGFGQIIKSKHNGCVSLAMTGNDMDLTAPHFSLYVDLVK